MTSTLLWLMKLKSMLKRFRSIKMIFCCYFIKFIFIVVDLYTDWNLIQSYFYSELTNLIFYSTIWCVFTFNLPINFLFREFKFLEWLDQKFKLWWFDNVFIYLILLALLTLPILLIFVLGILDLILLLKVKLGYYCF